MTIFVRLRSLGGHDANGFKRIVLEWVNGAKVVDAKSVLSGGASRQDEAFVHPSQDYAGSMRPVPEGLYSIGKTVKGNFGEGLGTSWTPVEVLAKYRVNNRGAFGFHDDSNRTRARGSAGCIVTHSKADLDYIERWFASDARPEFLVVDWGLGFLAEKGFKYPGDPSHKPPTPTPVPSKPVDISATGLSLVKHFEGLYTTAYVDPVGVLTIGYGHTGPDVFRGQVITEAQAEQLLRKDMDYFENAVNRLCKVSLKQCEFDALVSFAFNCGEGALSTSTLLRKLNAGDKPGAANELLRWNKGTVGGKLIELPGLTRRRNAERHLFLTGELKTQF